MSFPPLIRPKIESWVSRVQERGESMIAYYEGTLVGHVAYLPTEKDESKSIVFVDSPYQNWGPKDGTVSTGDGLRRGRRAPRAPSARWRRLMN